MAEVVLEKVYKKYPKTPAAPDGVLAVEDFNLEIKDKEFVVFVGPSGCGKTTTLRMIAGLEDITDGHVKIDEKVVNNIPPKDRDIAMVFQNYALYPHMTVRQNMSFGLKLRKTPKKVIEKRVEETAELLQLKTSSQNLLDRRPKELSGGQRQRVALGRAIVRKPKVFLMDEPLSNLDAKLRVDMRAELSKLHQELGVTTIYVTHDQVEAMTMGTRIVVMKDGLIQQVDSPINLYENPQNRFVAGFMGSPAMNFVTGTVDGGTVKGAEGSFTVTPDKKLASKLKKSFKGKEVFLGVRPEDLNVKGQNTQIEDTGSNTIKAKVEVIEPLGAETVIIATTLGNYKIVARVEPHVKVAVNKQIEFLVDTSKLHAFETSGQELNIRYQ